MSLTSNSRSAHHLKRYFATGKISRQAASQVFRDWSLVVDNSLWGAAAVIWGLNVANNPCTRCFTLIDSNNQIDSTSSSAYNYARLTSRRV